MKIKIALLFVVIFTTNKLQAQNPSYPKYRIINGDTMPVIQMNEAVITAKHVWENDTARYNYNQMKLYIQTVMPYAQEGIKLFNTINEKSATLSGGERRRYIKIVEDDVKAKFEDKLKALNVTQGKYLVKIMNRQLSTTCYDMIKTLHNPLKARSYQIWANLNGIDLNEYYDPNDNKDFENIVRGLGY